MVKEIEATVLASGCVKLTVKVSLPETLAAVLLNAGSAAEAVTINSEHSILIASIKDSILFAAVFIVIPPILLHQTLNFCLRYIDLPVKHHFHQ